MNEYQLLLAIIEIVKCLSFIWLGFIVLWVSKTHFENKFNGSQLKHIKIQGKFVFGTILIFIILLFSVLWGVHEISEFKRNYTILWKRMGRCCP